jgi:HSP20 family protein
MLAFRMLNTWHVGSPTAVRVGSDGQPGWPADWQNTGEPNLILPEQKSEIMNTLTRWDPFKEMDELQRRLGSLFGTAPARRAENGKESLTVAEWSPLVDITEDDKEYLIKADLPEVKKADVKVTVENGVLAITGERRFEKEEKDKRYHRIERSYGSFVRSFSLPDDADADKVSAEFKDGVLLVHLAKNEKARPKSIEVKVA